MNKDLLSFADFSAAELGQLLDLATRLKQTRGGATGERPLAGKTVAMIFSKSSTRTRVSFEVGIHELGGQPLFFGVNDLQLGRGESMSDTAQVLSRYVHGAVIRAHAHHDLEEFAKHSSVPVINALTDSYHPCQLLADLQTINEQLGRLDGVKVAYLGDGASNMARSWILAAVMAGIELRIGAPEEYQAPSAFVDGAAGPGSVQMCTDPVDAVNGADIVYTDVWVSMGFEAEGNERIENLQPYQVDETLMGHASPTAKVMHCLPAKRGLEITSSVLDGPQSIIWEQAENRLHAQKAVLSMWCGR